MRHLLKFFVASLAIVLFSTACMKQIQTEIIPTASAVIPSTTPSIIPSLPLTTATPKPTITSTPIPTHTLIVRIPTAAPATAMPINGPVVSAPPGLIYSDGIDQWLITANNGPKQIVDDPHAYVSPDRHYAIYRRCGCEPSEILIDLTTGITRTFKYEYFIVVWSPDSKHVYFNQSDKNGIADIWVEDILTGKRQNLSRTPDRTEWLSDLWPDHSDYLFFYSWPSTVTADGPGWLGYPSIMRTDGTNYQVASSDLLSSPASLSSDGKTIAYATFDQSGYSTIPWHFRLNERPKQFPWKDWGVANFKIMRFSSPSWSSDGNRLAWWMSSYDENDQKKFGGIAIFDLKTGKSYLFDHFGQFVIEGWPSTVDWSPNSKEIAFYSDGEQTNIQHTDAGIWIIDIERKSARQLVNVNGFCSWSWRPDGQWLAFTCDDPKLAPGIWLVEIETGKIVKADLSSGVKLIGWANVNQ
jgi:hypothetical protein